MVLGLIQYVTGARRDLVSDSRAECDSIGGGRGLGMNQEVTNEKR